MFYLAACILPLLLFVCWYKYAYAPYRLFKRIGIPHPPVTPFFGNGVEFLHQRSVVNTVEKFLSKYGKLFGYYIGSAPAIVVADLDMIKEITVKQFDKFTDSLDQPSFSVQMHLKENVGFGLLFEKGEIWKRVRQIVSPTFSSKKLKLMTPLLEKSCNSLVERIEEISNSGQSAHLCKLYRQFTMESTLAAAFGSQVNVLKGEANSLTEAAESLVGQFNDRIIVWAQILSSQFPILDKVLSHLGGMLPVFKHFHSIVEVCQNIIHMRRKQNEYTQTHNDFVQILIDAAAAENDNTHKIMTLTDGEIIGACFDFYIAGYETTSSLLSFTSYLLALNPDKQDLLCEAISNYYQENEDATLYDASQGIPYLDWVIQESLRLYPPAPMMVRTCTETCTINGIIFQKGIIINFPLRYNHHSSEYWDEPDVFEPNRFSPEGKEGRNPLCHLPFGWGPRSCIGMRFALMEAKMALVSILKSYKFERGPDTQIPLKLHHHVTQSPKDGVFLKVIQRK